VIALLVATGAQLTARRLLLALAWLGNRQLLIGRKPEPFDACHALLAALCGGFCESVLRRSWLLVEPRLLARLPVGMNGLISGNGLVRRLGRIYVENFRQHSLSSSSMSVFVCPLLRPTHAGLANSWVVLAQIGLSAWFAEGLSWQGPQLVNWESGKLPGRLVEFAALPHRA